MLHGVAHLERAAAEVGRRAKTLNPLSISANPLQDGPKKTLNPAIKGSSEPSTFAAESRLLPTEAVKARDHICLRNSNPPFSARVSQLDP